jgi:hypothetical protein
MDLTASSAVNLPISSASLWLSVIKDGRPINPSNVFGGAGTAPIDFHNEFDVFHI